ncbi:F-box/RNI-like/FBD-like domains-containing protein [Rhynchospora pubera]|uniref:F-box/RNI-like/FBD-like domains-containing protein n=1 Tax=Rhynchospora pubera TaxID=906938 RepID=A0AAV8AHE0_9POAL|nr:F-box/RNI-like/FBD-like domains-containing protein [Rhynchospora pubera]
MGFMHRKLKRPHNMRRRQNFLNWARIISTDLHHRRESEIAYVNAYQMMPRRSARRANFPSPTIQMIEPTTIILPIEIICTIISLLPACDVARCSILSKQWKRIWLSNVNWKLTSSDYPSSRLGAEQQYLEFINDVVVFHTGPGIRKMLINLTNHGAFHRSVVFWMDYLASHYPINELDIDVNGPVVPPASLFSCTTLVSLRLVLHDACLIIPTEVHLNSLKELCLEHPRFAESGDAQRLINSCRILNKLEFKGCSGNPFYDLHLEINLPELKVFNFQSSSDYIYVHVAAMNLEIFTFKGRNLIISEGVEFPFLKEVNLDEYELWIQYRIFNRRRVPTEQSASKMHKTVSSFKMAKKLFLSQWCTEHLSNIQPEINLPNFEILTSLSIEFWPNDYHANVMLYIINCSPNLQQLYARTYMKTRTDVTEPLYDYFHLQLKYIEMDSFSCSNVEMRLVERLAGCCLQLRRLNINLISEIEQPIRRNFRRVVRSIKKLSPKLIVSVC